MKNIATDKYILYLQKLSHLKFQRKVQLTMRLQIKAGVIRSITKGSLVNRDCLYIYMYI